MEYGSAMMGAFLAIVAVSIVAICGYLVLKQSEAKAVADKGGQVAMAPKQEVVVAQRPPPEAPSVPPTTIEVMMVVEPPANDHLGAASAPVTFRQVGYVELGGGAEATPTLAPLYGRQSQVRRHRWYYYVLLDGIKLPVISGKRDCMEEVGCDELADGDAVSVGGRASGAVRIYRAGIAYA